MIGVIERIKNNVLLKCSILNDQIINKSLISIIDTSIHRIAEDIYNLINGLNFNIDEVELRKNIDSKIKKVIIKKINRKLFIDSLALQITNDYYIEAFVKKEIDIKQITKGYIKELNKNKNSNQLNMVEDLDLTEIFSGLYDYVEKNINIYLSENEYLINTINSKINENKKELEKKLKEMISNMDNEYLNILYNEFLSENLIIEESKKEDIIEYNEVAVENEFSNNYKGDEFNMEIVRNSKFDKYDDMTLFNKTILSLNTKEEKLSRKEKQLLKRKEEVDKRLSATNSNIEANIERENALSQRKVELNNREININSKLSEAEVIFLNMKPLINGLNKIKSSDLVGGKENE